MPDAGSGGAAIAAPEVLLAFDYGEKKIGVAIGNTLTGQARPLEILASTPLAVRFARIEALLAEWQPTRLVVGLALAADGGNQPATQRCRRFANQLHGRFGARVALVDERHSSMQAQSMKKGGDDDALAAMVILQRYLDDPTPLESIPSHQQAGSARGL